MAMDKDNLLLKFGADSPHLKVNIFNNYRIIGLLEEVGSKVTKGCSYSLLFNHTNKQFYFFKKFTSGKIHIDFFKNEDGHTGELYHLNDDILLLNFITDYCIAKSVGYDLKTLHFYQDKQKYVVRWSSNNNFYAMEF
jgi:hypothetical protein